MPQTQTRKLTREEAREKSLAYIAKKGGPFAILAMSGSNKNRPFFAKANRPERRKPEEPVSVSKSSCQIYLLQLKDRVAGTGRHETSVVMQGCCGKTPEECGQTYMRPDTVAHPRTADNGYTEEVHPMQCAYSEDRHCPFEG